MILNIDIESLFPEGLSDETVSAIADLLMELALQWESKNYTQISRYRKQQEIDFSDSLPF
jgi:hypothetical protein